MGKYLTLDKCRNHVMIIIIIINTISIVTFSFLFSNFTIVIAKRKSLITHEIYVIVFLIVIINLL